MNDYNPLHPSLSEVKLPVKKKLPCLVWNMMSEKNLREQCKKHSLPSNGRKGDFIKRLKEYTLRHNSQLEHRKQKSGEFHKYAIFNNLSKITKKYALFFA